MPRLILGSGSVHRRRLLARLRLDVETREPGVDESAKAGETARELALRLAEAKAERVARNLGDPGAVIIGADQTAAREGRLLRKPGDRNTAVEQLLDCRGAVVSFHTACVIRDERNGRRFTGLDQTRVHFAALDRGRIERYVDLERPFDCTGGFKAEGLGITLFESIESTDPTALLGLPLIWLCGVLREIGLDPLDPFGPAGTIPTYPG